MLTASIEAEVEQYLANINKESLNVIRNGKAPKRQIQTGIGPIEVARSKMRVKDGAIVDPFQSKILPRYLRKAKSVEELIPWLYLKGVSTGDRTSALEPLMGKGPRGVFSIDGFGFEICDPEGL